MTMNLPYSSAGMQAEESQWSPGKAFGSGDSSSFSWILLFPTLLHQLVGSSRDPYEGAPYHTDMSTLCRPDHSPVWSTSFVVSAFLTMIWLDRMNVDSLEHDSARPRSTPCAYSCPPGNSRCYI